MLESDKQNKPEKTAEITARQSLIDLALVFGISLIVFLLERLASKSGLINIPASATGVTAVLAGSVTAVLLVFFRRQKLSEIGFRSPRSWKTVPLWVIGIFGVFVVAQIVLPMVVGLFFEMPATDLSRYDSLYQNLPAVIMVGLLLPITASIPEEIIYRGFLMDRLTRIFGEKLPGLILTVAIQSLIFGAIHFQWGLGGMISTALMGVIWGTSFLLVGRNLWIVIMAHSLGHIAMITQLYFIKGSELG
jgi:membrane protease YdiL (CAAX protease family)